MNAHTLPTFEIGPIRPPSEGGGNSLLVRVTRNCPWSRCKFCFGTLYDRGKFELRGQVDIKADIDAMKTIAEAIRDMSWKRGYGGMVNDAVGAELLRRDPTLQWHHGFAVVFNWMASGGHTAFLQDADSLIMRTAELEEAVRFLRTSFPSLDRVTSYARAKTVFRKGTDELRGLRSAGLNRLHVGLETGDDELLALMDKGITAEQHILSGRKAKESGFELSLYVMPDLGGRRLWRQHAENTARVLNAINPDYIRSRPFVPRDATPFYSEYASGSLELSSPHQRLEELRLLVQNLTVASRVCFDHFANSWRSRSGRPLFVRDYEGYMFPHEKERVLELIDEGLAVEESHHIHVRDMMGLPRM